jgi:hypothetical protein
MTRSPAQAAAPSEAGFTRPDRATSTDSTGPETANHRAVLLVTCLALATVVSAVTSLNVALPSIARDNHSTQTQLTWVIDACALV